MGGSCYQFLHFRDRPSIQTMASVCFAMNSIHLVAVLYAAMSADDAIVMLKLNGIESTVTELHIAGGSRFVLYYITIFADLFLIIGIEDFTLIMSFLSCLGLTLLVQGFFTRRVFHYSSLVRPSVRIHAHGEMMPSNMALVEPGPTPGQVGGKEGDEESTETKTAHRTTESRNVTDSTKREPGPNSGEESSAIKKSPPQ
ncbi:uncharacterized protein [Dermacentor albipictus]|uniref:uncharacterized protein isoform X3 n=1 Tax=Dermacentor albipictus TaxID=60249 RepID=UPI0031FDE043